MISIVDIVNIRNMVKIITKLKTKPKGIIHISLFCVRKAGNLSVLVWFSFFIVCRLSTSTANAISDDKSHFYSFLKTVSLMII